MNYEDIRKGISFAAFGFLFILVSLNLTFNGLTVNVMPDFIGWALLFFAVGRLSSYYRNQQYVKWIALILVILTLAIWLVPFVRPDMDSGVLGILKAVSNLITAVEMFLFLGPIVEIAREYGSSTEGTISFLRWFNMITYAVLAVVGVIADKVTLAVIAGMVAVLGILLLASAIITLITLFRLRKDINAIA